MKYSIIIPSWNNYFYLSACIQSVIRNTKDYELIIVLNGCTDPSLSLLRSLNESDSNILFINCYARVSFSAAVNLGFLKSTGDNIILLNNDTLVTPNWADQLFNCISDSENFFGFDSVGAVGPVSNNASGMQLIEHDNVNISTLDLDAIDFHNKYINSFLFSGFLSGFCLLITRKCFLDVGKWDESYLVGGFEDNDFSLRAYLKGWKFVIDRSTFIFHYGQMSLSGISDSYKTQFNLNQLSFYKKFYVDKPQILTVITRIHNGIEYLPDFISSVRTYADNLIAVCDRCTDDSIKFLTDSGFPTIIKSFNDSFNENRDRQYLINTSIKNGSDWILSLDVDEQMDQSFTKQIAQRLMHPVNPEIQSYIFRFKNFWINQSFYRTDGVFGSMTGLRMFRIVPNSSIISKYDYGLHCSHVPLSSPIYTRSLPTSILHFGYNTAYKRASKYSFYTSIDKNPDRLAVGPDGYNHLISPSVSLEEYKPNCTLGLCMIVKNEEPSLLSFLSRYYHFFDQIVIVDTGSSDYSSNISSLFNACYYRYSVKFDFSSARNFAKSKVKTSWILSMDPDEEIDIFDFPKLYNLLTCTPSAYLFQVANILPNNTIGYSDNVRLFRNIPEIYWSGLVHENISKSITESKLSFSLAPLTIKHFGYLKPKNIQVSKSKLYESLLLKELKLNPKNAINHFHMAFFYFERDKPEIGIAELELCLKLQPDFFLAQKELGLYYLQKSLQYFLKFSSDVPENHFFKKWSEQILELLNKAMQLSPGNLF